MSDITGELERVARALEDKGFSSVARVIREDGIQIIQYLRTLSQDGAWCFDMSKAPKDKAIWVWCPPRESLEEIICICQWDEYGGFCVDELRTPMAWLSIVVPCAPLVKEA